MNIIITIPRVPYLEADFELVRHKCIKYAHTLAIDYKIDDQFVKECENFIQEMVRKFNVTAKST